MQKGGEVITSVSDDKLQTSGIETATELNLGVFKFMSTIKKKSR